MCLRTPKIPTQAAPGPTAPPEQTATDLVEAPAATDERRRRQGRQALRINRSSNGLNIPQ